MMRKIYVMAILSRDPYYNATEDGDHISHVVNIVRETLTYH